MELVKEVKELLIRDGQRSQRAAHTACFWHEQYRLWEKEVNAWQNGSSGGIVGRSSPGQHELEQGIVCLDAFSSRGRKRSEEHLPHLLHDLMAMVDGQSQADPRFRTNRPCTRLMATEARRQLIAQYGYSDDALPTAETIATKLDELGYYPNKVAKSRPQKHFPKLTPSLLS